MPAPSIQTLQHLADETGNQLDTLEKVLRLLDILQEIAGDSFLSDRLVLKGGTALNAFHLGLDRLSVDIDLNYIGALDREMLAFLFELTPNEQEFLDRLLDIGQIDASLLNVAPEVQARIDAMPMLAWKAQHVRTHRDNSL